MIEQVEKGSDASAVMDGIAEALVSHYLNAEGAGESIRRYHAIANKLRSTLTQKIIHFGCFAIAREDAIAS